MFNVGADTQGDTDLPWVGVYPVTWKSEKLQLIKKLQC
jgi:hypothetical protein